MFLVIGGTIGTATEPQGRNPQTAAALICLMFVCSESGSVEEVMGSCEFFLVLVHRGRLLESSWEFSEGSWVSLERWLEGVGLWAASCKGLDC